MGSAKSEPHTLRKILPPLRNVVCTLSEPKRVVLDYLGPPYVHWGKTVLYKWQTALQWAEDRAGIPRATTAEHKVMTPYGLQSAEPDAPRRSNPRKQ